jgi:HSP20 family protein
MTKKLKERAKQSKVIVHHKPAQVVPQRAEKVVPQRAEKERWFDHVLEDVLRRPFQSLWRSERWLPETLIPSAMPSMDIYQEKDTVVVRAELPGMAREQIEVTLAGEMLTVKGEKKKEEDVKEQNYHRHERSYGAFVRSVSLPCGVQSDAANATLKDGVLEVRLPKTEEAKTRSIAVKID